MKALLIAEKASLMRAVQSAVNTHGFSDKIDFFSLHGHIMSLLDPGEYHTAWQRWNLDTLPMIPEQFRYRVSDIRLYEELKRILENGNYDYLINCCDPDREGQHIFYSIYDTMGLSLPVKRMWHNDLSDTELMRALHEMEDDLHEPRLVRLKEASKLRAQMDWLVGMNASRIVTLKRRSMTRLGRVMTPTFRILADRELAIRNFEASISFGLEAQYTNGMKALHVLQKEDGKYEPAVFQGKEEINRVITGLEKEGVVKERDSRTVKETPPQLPSLADIQSEANKAFGYTLDTTLNLVQSLYEKRLVSYPRTDCNYVTEKVAEDFERILNALRVTHSIGPSLKKVGKAEVNAVRKNKDYVNDDKVTAHYALIPTGSLKASLSEEEKKIFEMICKRFACIFLPAYQAEHTKALIAHGEQLFQVSGTKVLDNGYRKLLGSTRKDEALPAFQIGDTLTAETFEGVEHSTKAPNRFTDASLLKAMINAANYVEDEELSEVLKGDGLVKDSGGIGTPATRAAIVDKLVQPITEQDGKTYFLVYRRRRSFYVSDEGLDLMESLRDFDISSPELTAIWEKKLKEIENGEIDAVGFTEDMNQYTRDMAHQMMETTYARVIGRYLKGKCPLCGSRMKAMNRYYVCEKYSNDDTGCKFLLPMELHGAKIRDRHVEDICSGKPSKALRMKSPKTGRYFYASLVFNPETQKVEFLFEDGHPTKMTCPQCGGILKKKNGNYGDYLTCENEDFRISYTISGKKLKEAEMKQLLQEGEIKLSGFKGKIGKPFSSKLVLENGKVSFYFGSKTKNEENKQSNASDEVAEYNDNDSKGDLQ